MGLEVVLLALALVAGLLMIPFGLPGLWVIAGAVVLYAWLGPPDGVGTWTVVAMGTLAALGEIIEYVLAGRFARAYGGSRRAEWWAIIGSIAGAIVGVPVPLVGSMIGAFVGAFAGAWIAELTRRPELRAATRVATGALLGRIAAVGAKVGIGCTMLVWVVFVLWPGHRA
jgi:uncharacterized protein YqgC (DUF456 family)